MNNLTLMSTLTPELREALYYNDTLPQFVPDSFGLDYEGEYERLAKEIETLEIEILETNDDDLQDYFL